MSTAIIGSTVFLSTKEYGGDYYHGQTTLIYDMNGNLKKREFKNVLLWSSTLPFDKNLHKTFVATITLFEDTDGKLWSEHPQSTLSKKTVDSMRPTSTADTNSTFNTVITPNNGLMPNFPSNFSTKNIFPSNISTKNNYPSNISTVDKEIEEQLIHFAQEQSLYCMESPDKKRRIDCHNLLEEYNNRSDEENEESSESSDEEGSDNRRRERMRLADIKSKGFEHNQELKHIKDIKMEQLEIDEQQNEIIEQYVVEVSKKDFINELRSNDIDIEELSSKYSKKDLKKIKKI